MKNTKHALKIYLSLIFVFAACVLSSFGQSPSEPQQLEPNQTIERGMTGAETHRYKFDLKANEFFQVRVEQKGVDVTLKLTDEVGNVLATMDSPNGKEGFEILTFVALKDGVFILEVISPNEKTEKGNYIVKREASRTANEQDRKRVEAERYFAEIITFSIWRAGQELLFKSTNLTGEARSKLNEALAIYEAVISKSHNKYLLDIVKESNIKSEQILQYITWFHYASLERKSIILGNIADTYKTEGV